MTDKRYTKVEEEIIQILDRLENERPASPRPRLTVVPTRPRRSRRFKIRRPNLRTRPVWFWLVLSFALAALAYLLSDYSSTLALLIAIASAGSFFAPLFSRGPSTPSIGSSTTKTWRGKDITLQPSARDSAADRARRWLDGRRGGSRRF